MRTRAGLLLCGVLWMTGAAHAQPFKPRILLVFDTSGSMGVDVATGLPTGGDNSATYPGDGGLSRLAVAKAAIASIVETTSEVDFALMRYPQQQAEGVNRGPLSGHQLNTYEGLDLQPLNYVGQCAGRVRAGAPGEAFSVVVPFRSDNEPEILSWLDGQETWPDDPELRADGPTPIAETLRLAESYLRGVVNEDQAGARCRRNYVVLLTDGGESCVAPGEREAELVARTQALRQIPVQVGIERVDVDVKTYVVAFAVSLTAAQRLGVVAREGGTDQGGLPFQAEDLAGLRVAFTQILREAIPVELCNGLDDDCDGLIDEGVLNACGQCGEAPPELCNGLDDDCDGLIDEGVLNACGRCGPVPEERCNGVDDDCDGLIDEQVVNACGGCAAVQEEICNGLDDDCDGRVDNLPGGDEPLGRPCGRDVGECTTGRERCTEGTWQDCDGVLPRPEACNGLDDDCDGEADEDPQPCGPAVDIGDVGECRVGTRACDRAACEADPARCAEDGWLVECVGAVGPAEEICNGRDDDCDGEIDEGLFNACGRCGPTPPEACNGEDDNCDGRVDEDARCPEGYICFVGECVQPCDASGECAGDFACRQVFPGGRYCHPSACAGASCPAGSRCDPEGQRCVDPCAGVECAQGEICALGECGPVDCRTAGCAEDERCGAAGCEADPCAGVPCDEGAYCRQGRCVRACVRQACGAGQACVDGACAEDPCGGRCLRGQICDPTDGACVLDPCEGVYCAVGMACEGGECSADAPCAHIQCPPGTLCAAGQCTDFTPGVSPRRGAPRRDAGPGAPDAALVPEAGPAPEPDATVDAVDADAPTSGGGDQGCGCRSVGDPSEGATAPLLWLLGLLAIRRRRG